MDFKCTINPQNLIKIDVAIFEKIKFFSHVNYPYFRGRGKTKRTARDIYKRTLDIEFERDRSIGLGSTIGEGRTDGRSDRQTDRQTHTHRHFF